MRCISSSVWPVRKVGTEMIARMMYMRRFRHLVRALFSALLFATGLSATHAQSIHFSVLMHVMEDSLDESGLRVALSTAQAGDPAFIVVNGVRATREACSDRLFRQRISLLENASVPVILSLAGSDWMGCRDRKGRPAANAWLSLLREQAYGDISWSGGKHLALRRQSAIPAFRAYSENTRWVMDQVLFATLNLPANNNNFIASAGGNSEFEDRLIANRDWLKRLAMQAHSERRSLIVMFCDGNPLPASAHKSKSRDGYTEIRQQLKVLTEKSGAYVLVVQGAAPESTQSITTPAEIQWDGKLGYVSIRRGISSFEADLSAAIPVSLINSEP